MASSDNSYSSAWEMESKIESKMGNKELTESTESMESTESNGGMGGGSEDGVSMVSMASILSPSMADFEMAGGGDNHNASSGLTSSSRSGSGSGLSSSVNSRFQSDSGSGSGLHRGDATSSAANSRFQSAVSTFQPATAPPHSSRSSWSMSRKSGGSDLKNDRDRSHSSVARGRATRYTPL